MRTIKSVYKLYVLILYISGTSLQSPQESNLLTSYLPAAMQALAYYIDQLQYEPLSTTTVEPPFKVEDDEIFIDQSPTPVTSTTARPFGSNSSVSWTAPIWWGALTTSTQRPTKVTTTTTIRTTKRPAIWWQPPSSTLPTTNKPTSWWSYSTTTKRTTSTTTTPKPTTTWWSYSTPINRQPTTAPTLPHRPGIYAPIYTSSQHHGKQKQQNEKQQNEKQQHEKLEGYDLFNEIGDNPEGFDKLTLALIRDIQTEMDHDQFTNDFESLDNFLKLYDDNYGRAAFDPDAAMDRWSSTSTAGKKRIPPTKPYVEFLLVYDLLKRDAKAANLSKYEGYSPAIMQELHELSKASAERQLYTLFKRMLERGDIERSDVVSRIQSIQKDLGNPESITSKSLRYIPALPFVP